MDFCNECGSTTDPDWVFCRACGNSLDNAEVANTVQSAVGGDTPKVELISRGWDVVDVDAVEVPADPLQDDTVATPLPPGAIEVTIDDVTVVEAPAAEEEPAEDDRTTDSWDHLRPHGQIPGIDEPTRIPARVGQIMLLLAALGALVSTVLYFFLNIQLDAFAKGEVTDRAVADVRSVAEASLIVLGGLAALALIALVWWMAKAFRRSSFRPGTGGIVALLGTIGGSALVAFYATQQADTVAEGLTANSLVIIGLGLLMMAALATVRTLLRIEHKDRW